MADTEKDLKNGPQKRSILAKPKLMDSCSSSEANNSNTFVNSSSGSILRPPQLKPAVLSSNVFAILPVQEETDDEPKTKEAKTDDNETKVLEMPKFVPLGTTHTSRSTPLTVSESSTQAASSFVFGQNLSSRVVRANEGNATSCSSSATIHANTNGNACREEKSGSELLFTAAASTVENKVPIGSGESSSKLSELNEIEERPLPPPQAAPCTGEEGEHNVLQMSCRLFAWEGGWKERGRGVVRLNDLPLGGSRILVRACGSLRLLVNTKLWSEMTCEQPSLRCLRLTTNPALILLMGAPNDIANLNRAIKTRIALLKEEAADHHEAPCNEERINGSEVSHIANTSDDITDDSYPKLEGDELIGGDESSSSKKECENEEEQASKAESGVKRKDCDTENDPNSTPSKRQCPKVVID